MSRRKSFSDVLRATARETATAEPVVDAVERLCAEDYVPEIADYLLRSFGRHPKNTRIVIRAAGKSRSRELHDILAESLMRPEGRAYAYELIDALSETRAADYAAAIVPFLNSPHDQGVRSTAAHALGMLRSPVAILPLVKEYQRSRNQQMMNCCIQALRRILRGRPGTVSIDVYLSDTPKRVRERILKALESAA